MRKFNFSLRITLFCSTLAGLMIWASFWQYQRYIAKVAYIQELDRRLQMPIQEFSDLRQKTPETDRLLHHRVKLKGTWDYENEIILRNRKYQDTAGVYVITPLLISGPSQYRVLVSRGFLPLSVADHDKRKAFRNGPESEFVALVKESNKRKFLSPQDPETGPGKPRVDAWLRVDVEAISKQLPYPVEPLYLEMMSRDLTEVSSSAMVQEKSERDQILFMPSAGASLSSLKKDLKAENYPVPVFDPIVPAGRHFSYIFEWAIMATMVILTGVGLQLRQRNVR